MWLVLLFEQAFCFILQVQVALKKLKPHVLSNAVDLREFLSEANTLRRLKHRSANLCCKLMHAVHACYITDINFSDICL